jgi:cytochrome c-type biogenesis protein CcmH/NrfG
MVDARRSLPVLAAGERDPIERLAGGDSAGVIEELQRALSHEPGDEVAWLRLGAVFLAIGHLPEAEEALARTV